MMSACLAHACFTCLLATVPQAPAAPVASAALTKELVALMSARKQDAVATADPSVPGRFVAAMVYPGVQLLIVRSQPASASDTASRISYRLYRDAYSDVQQPANSDGKLFIQDMGADGLAATGDGSIDVMYEDVDRQTIFDGNWRKQKLTQAEYQKKFTSADAEYARMLSLLIAEMKR
jgi:hypothetical protein